MMDVDPNVRSKIDAVVAWVAAHFRGLFGPVEAYHGAVETQGRGGLHAHIHVS